MANIKHLLTIKAPAAKVYKAITEEKGLASWWTSDTKAKAELNSIAEFGFGNGMVKKMKITQLMPNQKVKWVCIEDANQEWVNTEFEFDLKEKDGSTVLLFSHNLWKAETEMFAICNYHWALFMQSLQGYCETGKGMPY